MCGEKQKQGNSTRFLSAGVSRRGVEFKGRVKAAVDSCVLWDALAESVEEMCSADNNDGALLDKRGDDDDDASCVHLSVETQGHFTEENTHTRAPAHTQDTQFRSTQWDHGYLLTLWA